MWVDEGGKKACDKEKNEKQIGLLRDSSFLQSIFTKESYYTLKLSFQNGLAHVLLSEHKTGSIGYNK